MLIKVIHKNTANKISHLCQITPKMRFIQYRKKKEHSQVMPLINIDRTPFVFLDKSNFALFSMNSKYLDQMQFWKKYKSKLEGVQRMLFVRLQDYTVTRSKS